MASKMVVSLLTRTLFCLVLIITAGAFALFKRHYLLMMLGKVFSEFMLRLNRHDATTRRGETRPITRGRR